jgi:hypothetical protein
MGISRTEEAATIKARQAMAGLDMGRAYREVMASLQTTQATRQAMADLDGATLLTWSYVVGCFVYRKLSGEKDD